MADVANPEEAVLSKEAQDALFGMLPALYSSSPITQSPAITSFAQNVKPMIDQMSVADRQKFIVAINANPKAASTAIIGLVTDDKGAFDPKKAQGALDNFGVFSETVLKKIAPAESAPVTATPVGAVLSQESKLALKGAMDRIHAGNPTVPEAQIRQISSNFVDGIMALPKDQADDLIKRINHNPEAAAESLYKSVTNGNGVFTPTPVQNMVAGFQKFSENMRIDIDSAPSLPDVGAVSPQIEKAMHAQLATAFEKGLVNSGSKLSPLSDQERQWLDTKMNEPGFSEKVEADAIASFRIDKTKGTYDAAALERYIEDPERFAYEAAKRVEQAAQPNAAQSFTSVASDPAKSSPALAAFEKKLGETKPDLKKQYDTFAASHAEFRGNMAQILTDVPEMADAAIENPALLKVAMEDSRLAAQKVRENKDLIRNNAGMLKTATADMIRPVLGMPTPPGETTDPGMTRSGEMLRSVIQMIGQFLAKVFPSLGPYVDQFADMAGKVGSTAAVFMGIDKPGTQSTGDRQLAADARTAANPDAKPADSKPADAKPAEDPAVADQRRRAALAF